MPKPHVFDFDAEQLADYDPERIDRHLTEHPDLYLNHLAIAKFLEGWRDRMNEQRAGRNKEEDSGVNYALGEVIAHLRQGDFIPSDASLIAQPQGEGIDGIPLSYDLQGEPIKRSSSIK